MLYVCFCDPGPMWFFIPKFSAAHPQTELKTSLFARDENPAQLKEIHLKEYCPEEIENISIFNVGGNFLEKRQKR